MIPDNQSVYFPMNSPSSCCSPSKSETENAVPATTQNLGASHSCIRKSLEDYSCKAAKLQSKEPTLDTTQPTNHEKAPIDQCIIQTLCQGYGPNLSEMLRLSAHNNTEDGFGLAKEACKVMADQVDIDLAKLFATLSNDDRNVLIRLKSELIAASKGCTYPHWVYLSAKFTTITGFAYYRAEPSKFTASGTSPAPELSKKLQDIEGLKWEMVKTAMLSPNQALEYADTHYSQVSEIHPYFLDILRYTALIRIGGGFPLPSFQPVDIPFFNNTRPLAAKLVGVCLEDRMDADNEWMTRGMFFNHDLIHSYLMLLSEAAPDVLEATRQCGLNRGFGILSQKINSLASDGDVTKALALLIFMKAHEGAYSLDKVICRYKSVWKPSYMGANPVEQLATEFRLGSLRDLKPDYGYLFGAHPSNKSGISTKAAYAAFRILNQLSIELETINPVSVDTFTTTLSKVVNSFSKIQNNRAAD